MAAERRHLVLSGPPGAGKTSTGRALAARLGRRFVDLDEHLAEVSAQSVAALLRERGEGAFRALERAELERVLDLEAATVIAVGGGALVCERARLDALRRALVVGLSAPVEVLLSRLAGDPAPRPLLDATGPSGRHKRLSALLRARASSYACAHVHVSTVGRGPDVVAAEIAVRLASGVEPITVGIETAYAVQRCPGAAAERVAAEAAAFAPTRVLIVTDDVVGRLHLDSMRAELSPHEVFVLSHGEERKTVEQALQIVARLGQMGADRRSLLIALGGGVVTDLAGFAASLFARGIPWIAVPTTVIGMVDAATGGKTGANLAGVKNAIGTFHHPRAVVLDPSYARTETPRAVRSGLAEAVKSACVGDAAAFAALEATAASIVDERGDALASAIASGVRVKARIVEADPGELGGLRAILNFGHTMGHALESASAFSRWTHGEAVSLGMVFAARLGESLGVTPSSVAERLVSLLSALGLPTSAPGEILEGAWPFLRSDKKREGDLLRFVLLTDIGAAAVHSVTEDQVRAAASGW